MPSTLSWLFVLPESGAKILSMTFSYSRVKVQQVQFWLIKALCGRPTFLGTLPPQHAFDVIVLKVLLSTNGFVSANVSKTRVWPSQHPSLRICRSPSSMLRKSIAQKMGRAMVEQIFVSKKTKGGIAGCCSWLPKLFQSFNPFIPKGWPFDCVNVAGSGKPKGADVENENESDGNFAAACGGF